MKLNEKQLEAVNYDGGPLMIIAGAGTGKTTVLIERIKSIVEKSRAKAEEVLALTFSEKAANEIEERLDLVLPYGKNRVVASTFHSFCDGLIKEEGLAIGIDTNYQLMSEVEAMGLFGKNLFEFPIKKYRPLGNPRKFITGILKHFSRLKDEGVDAEEYLKWSRQRGGGEESYEELAMIYAHWEKVKVESGVMEFGDLLCHALKLVRSPQVKNGLRNKYKCILVDEFQDTNWVQNELLWEITGGEGQITAVGDDDQAIYRWRGAAFGNMIDFIDRYKNVKSIVLKDNYRSSQIILDLAYKLITNNNPDRLEFREGIDKKLIACNRGNEGDVKYLQFENAWDEAEAISEEIEKLNSGGMKLTDIAILVRANAHAAEIVRALERRSIPVAFQGQSKLMNYTEIKDLIAYLRVVDNIGDDLSMYRITSAKEIGIGAVDIAVIMSFAKKENKSLFSVFRRIANDNLDKNEIEVSEEGILAVKKFFKLLLKHIEDKRDSGAGKILYEWIKEMGYLKRYIDSEIEDDIEKARRIAVFFEKLREFENRSYKPSFREVVEWVDLSLEVGESSKNNYWSEGNAVNVMTIHAAKGLEWKVVFMVNLVNGRFPSTLRKEQIPIPDELVKDVLPQGDFHMEDERRLFYVGMTRAKEKLILTGSCFYGEGKSKRKKSTFVSELCLNDNELIRKDLAEKIPSFRESANATRQKQAKIEVNELSYSRIQEFDRCPVHFWAKYIVGVKTHEGGPLIFGDLIHKVLHEFGKWKLEARDKEAAVWKLMQIYSQLKMGRNFIHEKEESDYEERGREMLDRFLNSRLSGFGTTVRMEDSFVVKLSKEESELRIVGKWDRVDIDAEGMVEIIDYKTGEKSKNQKEVDQDLQLSIYALAAMESKKLEIDDIEKVKLTLFYLFDGETISTTRTKQQLEDVKSELWNYKKRIEDSNWECTGGIICERCEYKILCDSEES